MVGYCPDRAESLRCFRQWNTKNFQEGQDELMIKEGARHILYDKKFKSGFKMVNIPIYISDGRCLLIQMFCSSIYSCARKADLSNRS